MISDKSQLNLYYRLTWFNAYSLPKEKFDGDVTSVGYAAQRDTISLEKWDCVKFDNGKHNVLNLEENLAPCTSNSGCLRSSLTETDLRVLIDSRLNISQQCALAAQRTKTFLVCLRGSPVSSPEEGIFLSTQHC